MSKKILLSGVKPTGKVHIGNYFGAMKQFIDLQNEYETSIFIADLHALTTVQNGAEMKALTHNLVLDYLAIGLDPAKVTIFKQSDTPEVTELGWVFNCITTMPYLMRAHAFKDAEAKNKELNVGVFDYPLLMAADILIQNADVVPVGQDQKQHLEIAKDTAEKFNRIFGETFKLPQPLILKDVAVVPGLDGQKMSKSYGNTIELFATEEEIKKGVMRIPTDSKGVEEPKDPETCNVFALHKLFSQDTLPAIEKRYREGGIGYKESKELLAANVERFIKPLREKRAAFAENPELVSTILEVGAKKARARAMQMMEEVRKKIGTAI